MLKNTYIVKLVHRGQKETNDSPWKLQTPGDSGEIGNCKFVFNPKEKNYDWLVVLEDIPRVNNHVEYLNCPRENTIFVTGEPSSITCYGESFVKQFHYLITNQTEEELPHPNALRSQTGNRWLYKKSYNDILNSKPYNKTKFISTICSNKQDGHTIHKLRFEITEKLQKKFPELERYGRGYNWIENKPDAIDPFMFHIVIENQHAKDVWTEKIADTFLGYSVPIYFGSTNIFDYFPKESLIAIDIYNVDQTIEIIENILRNPKEEYQKRLPFLIEARKKVIKEYNLLEMINKLVINSEEYKFTENQKIYSRKRCRTKSIKDLFKFIKFKIKNIIRDFIK